MCSYMTKAETEGLARVVAHSLQRLPSGTTERRQLQRIGTAVLGQREYSLQEAAFLMMGWPLRGSNTSFVDVSVGYPQHRTRIINTGILRERVRLAQPEPDEGDGGVEADDELEDGGGRPSHEQYHRVLRCALAPWLAWI